MRTRSEKPESKNLNEVLKTLEIPPDGWDILIFGDGAGSNWLRECGWASVSIERETMERRVWYGGANVGTSNFAELMAHLQPLTWLLGREADRLKDPKARRRALRVHVITDSSYCEDLGSSTARTKPKNVLLWRILEDCRRHGLIVAWHWLPRNTLDLTESVDKLSKAALKIFKEQAPEFIRRRWGDPADVYDANPEG